MQAPTYTTDFSNSIRVFSSFSTLKPTLFSAGVKIFVHATAGFNIAFIEVNFTFIRIGSFSTGIRDSGTFTFINLWKSKCKLLFLHFVNSVLFNKATKDFFSICFTSNGPILPCNRIPHRIKHPHDVILNDLKCIFDLSPEILHPRLPFLLL